jgi:glycine C-acetyltransferase
MIDETLDFPRASFKTYEKPEGKSLYEKVSLFMRYTENWNERDHWNFRRICLRGAGPEVELDLPYSLKHIKHKTFVATGFNDYLGLSQHPEVIAAGQAGMGKYGAGTTASPAIGGQMDFHEALEKKIAGFYHMEDAVLFTTGYTANSATMQALFKDNDLAIVDGAAHASMHDGIKHMTVKTFGHNRMDQLEHCLSMVEVGKYNNVVVVVDGVYSQPGDLAPLDKVVELCKHFGALLAVDDAHGVGVIGATGRGVIELHNAYKDVDIITGTFSKTFGHLGGYVVGKRDMIHYLKYQAGQHIFSVSASPASVCLLTSIDLVDSERWRMHKLWDNTNYYKDGLHTLGLDTGNSASAIVPVMTGEDVALNAEVCRLLLRAGVYANQIAYPAVSMNTPRIRTNLTALHEKHHIDRILNGFEDVTKAIKSIVRKHYTKYTCLEQKRKLKTAMPTGPRRCCCWKPAKLWPKMASGQLITAGLLRT